MSDGARQSTAGQRGLMGVAGQGGGAPGGLRKGHSLCGEDLLAVFAPAALSPKSEAVWRVGGSGGLAARPRVSDTGGVFVPSHRGSNSELPPLPLGSPSGTPPGFPIRSPRISSSGHASGFSPSCAVVAEEQEPEEVPEEGGQKGGQLPSRASQLQVMSGVKMKEAEEGVEY